MDFSNMDATSWATVWVTISLVIFLGILGYFGVHKTIAAVLDKRIKSIQDELDEASKLREEAAALLVEYEQKRASAEQEAQDIVAAAKQDAERMAAEAQASIEELIVRRTKSVEDKIAQAESQAIADVRSRSADLTIEAARLLLTNEVATKGDGLIDRAIVDVGARLN